MKLIFPKDTTKKEICRNILTEMVYNHLIEGGSPRHINFIRTNDHFFLETNELDIYSREFRKRLMELRELKISQILE